MRVYQSFNMMAADIKNHQGRAQEIVAAKEVTIRGMPYKIDPKKATMTPQFDKVKGTFKQQLSPIQERDRDQARELLFHGM